MELDDENAEGLFQIQHTWQQLATKLNHDRQFPTLTQFLPPANEEVVERQCFYHPHEVEDVFTPVCLLMGGMMSLPFWSHVLSGGMVRVPTFPD